VYAAFQHAQFNTNTFHQSKNTLPNDNSICRPLTQIPWKRSLFSKRTFRTRAVILQSTSGNRMPLPKGSIVALVTPFNPEPPYEIDVDALKALLKLHLDAGTNGLCILGTTGEASVMTMEERALVINTTVELCKGTIPILVGCGTIDPNDVKDQIQQAQQLNADAVMVVTPYYVKPPQRCLVNHFCTAADQGMPLVVYNVPGRTGVDCKPETLAQCLNSHPNIVAVKEATGDVSRIAQIQQCLTPEAKQTTLLYSGDDGTTLEFISKGGDGAISVTANVAPRQWQMAINAALKGDMETAQQLNEPINSLHSDLFCEANPIPVKWAMERARLIPSGVCRPPLASLDPPFFPKVEAALRQAKLIE